MYVDVAARLQLLPLGKSNEHRTSTGIGTLLIPIWLLLDHRELQVSRLLVYLLTIAGFYLVLGLMIIFAADFLLASNHAATMAPDEAAGHPDTRGNLWLLIVQLLIGI